MEGVEKPTITLGDLELGPHEMIVGYVCIVRTQDAIADDPKRR